MTGTYIPIFGDWNIRGSTQFIIMQPSKCWEKNMKLTIDQSMCRLY